MKLVSYNKFGSVMNDILLSKNVSPQVAEILTSSLIKTSLKGIDSHGIHLFPHYISEIDLGRLNVNPTLKFKHTSNSTALLDAENTMGHYAGQQSMVKAIELAKQNGVGVVSVNNSNHFGAAWFFTDIAAKSGMVGIALTNTESLVNVYNSKESFFGTNPFCFSAPMKNEEPFCLDMATSTVPWNKIKNYRQQNIELENGWAYDKNGNYTVDPHKAKTLSSIGSYKGFGLGMVIEILCSGLAQGPTSKQIIPLYDLNDKRDRKISHFFLALDISRFTSIEWFESYLLNIASEIRCLPKSNTEAVLIAGDKEKESVRLRKKQGIPINDDKFEEFLIISKDFESSII